MDFEERGRGSLGHCLVAALPYVVVCPSVEQLRGVQECTRKGGGVTIKAEQACRLLFLEGFRPWQVGKTRSPEGTRQISLYHGSELSAATIVPQGDAVADMTHSEDELNLIP